MAEAASRRPEVVGQTLNEISRKDPEILEAVLEVMETEKLLASGARVDVLPQQASLLVQLDGSGSAPKAARTGGGQGVSIHGQSPPHLGVS